MSGARAGRPRVRARSSDGGIAAGGRGQGSEEFDGAEPTAREIADLLGHAQVSLTRNYCFGRRFANPSAAAALDAGDDQEDGSHG